MLIYIGHPLFVRHWSKCFTYFATETGMLYCPSFIDEKTKGLKGHTDADVNGWNDQDLNIGSPTKFNSSYFKLLCSITLYAKVVCVTHPCTWRFYVNRKSAVWQTERFMYREMKRQSKITGVFTRTLYCVCLMRIRKSENSRC